MFKPESATLNSRNELFNTCRHRKQKLLNPKKLSKKFPSGTTLLTWNNIPPSEDCELCIKSYETNL